MKPAPFSLLSRRYLPSLLGTAALLLGGGANPALAEDRCQLQLSQPVIDYGAYTRTQPTAAQRGGGLMPVGSRTLNLTASCGPNSVIALTFKGERGNERGYRFAKGGIFMLKVTEAQLDGKDVRLRNVHAAEAGGGALIRPGDEVVPYEGANLAAGGHLTVQIEVAAMIDLAGTRVSADEEWEGSGHFEIRALTLD